MNLDDYHRERRESAARGNRIALGLDADEKADRLRDRFKAVSRRIERAGRLRRFRARLRKHAIWIGVFIGILGGGYLGIATASAWPVGLTLRHLLASPHCAMARAVDLAPAVRGSPGYWHHNDADGDGIACEPWPRG